MSKNRWSKEINKGIATGFILVLPNATIDYHKKVKGMLVRPELWDDSFLDKDVLNCIENPDEVYSDIHKRKSYVFYKKIKHCWIRVVTNKGSKNNILTIITPFKTPVNNHKKYFKKRIKKL